jgi:hypothetical protein
MAELEQQPTLANARLADDGDELTLSLARLRKCVIEQGQL